MNKMDKYSCPPKITVWCVDTKQVINKYVLHNTYYTAKGGRE